MFQLHLWLGLGFGLYVLLISVSGSAVVLRPQFPRWFVQNTVEPVGEMPGEAAIRVALARRFPDAQILSLQVPTRPERAVYVELQYEGQRQTRYYDPYREQDLGPTHPWPVATMEWLVRLHDELLLGRKGIVVNGIGGVLFLLMLVSGVLVWWRGTRRWRNGLYLHRYPPHGFLRQLHGALGFWSLPLMFVWGSTAIYFAWPAPFEDFIDWLDEDLNDLERPDAWLLAMLKLHFGRFRSMPWLSWVWIVLGLLPALYFITGLLLWYRRAGPGRQTS